MINLCFNLQFGCQNLVHVSKIHFLISLFFCKNIKKCIEIMKNSIFSKVTFWWRKRKFESTGLYYLCEFLIKTEVKSLNLKLKSQIYFYFQNNLHMLWIIGNDKSLQFFGKFRVIPTNLHLFPHNLNYSIYIIFQA